MDARPRLGHRPELDGIRGVAVLAVAAFHTGLRVLPGGWLGVDLFFVLSGFLITSLLLEERSATNRIEYRDFYVRRALRLLPALAVLLAVLADAVVIGIATRSDVRDVPWVLGFATNWAYAGGRAFGPLTHLWSLAVEEQFYLLWPIVLVGLLRYVPSPRRQLSVVVGVAATIALTRSALYAIDVMSARRAYFGGDVRADALLLGCALAIAHREGWLEQIATRVRALLWPAVALLAVVAIAPASPFGGIGPLLFAPVDVAAAVVVAAVVITPRSFPILRWRPLTYVGMLSYAFYLWHVPVMLVLGFSPVLKLLVAIPLSLAAAAVSRHLVERPALRLKRRFQPMRAFESKAVAGA